MKLTDLEPTSVEIALDDRNFPKARMWKGRLDGAPVEVAVLCVASQSALDQPRIDQRMRRLPLSLTVESELALDLVDARVA